MIRRLKVSTRGQGVKYLSLKVDHVSDGKFSHNTTVGVIHGQADMNRGNAIAGDTPCAVITGGVCFPVVKELFLTLTVSIATLLANHPTKETAHVRYCRALPEDP